MSQIIRRPAVLLPTMVSAQMFVLTANYDDGRHHSGKGAILALVFGIAIFLGGCGLILEAYTLNSAAESAFHQIYAGTMLIAGITAVSGGAILAALHWLGKELVALRQAVAAGKAASIPASGSKPIAPGDLSIACPQCGKANPVRTQVCGCGNQLVQ
jgi:hypothetical protein